MTEYSNIAHTNNEYTISPQSPRKNVLARKKCRSERIKREHAKRDFCVGLLFRLIRDDPG